MKPWALITGASAGIGLEFAKLFSADGFNLILVARNETRLQQLARDLETKHGVSTRVIVKDLTARDAPCQLFESLRDAPVSVLVNNAGFGWQGPFVTTELQRSRDMLQLNVDALVQLSYLFLQPMLAVRKGHILNVASTAAFQPGPLTAMYYASKAFVFSFSVALAEELAGTGVSVTTLCPGLTQTEFHDRARMKRSSRLFRMMSAEVVARAGYRGLFQGKRIVIPGLANKITSAISMRLPATFTARLVKKINGG